VALARPLSDSSKDRDSSVALDRRTDKFHDQHGFADARAAKHCGLSALHQRRQQINHLDTRMKEFKTAAQSVDTGRSRVDGPSLDVCGEVGSAISGFAEDIQQATEHRLTDWGPERRTGCSDAHASPQTGGIFESDGPRKVLIEMQLNLRDETLSWTDFDLKRFVYFGQRASRKPYVDDRTVHGNYAPRCLI
jgi:hypothetical protein